MGFIHDYCSMSHRWIFSLYFQPETMLGDINEEDTDLSLWKNLMEKLMFCGRAHVDDALLSFPLPCQREISQQWMW